MKQIAKKNNNNCTKAPSSTLSPIVAISLMKSVLNNFIHKNKILYARQRHKTHSKCMDEQWGHYIQDTPSIPTPHVWINMVGSRDRNLPF